MTQTEERVTCRCGLTMRTTPGGAKYCANCDTTQPQEAMGLTRRKTDRDIRFEMSWLSTMNAEYTDNTKPEVGNPNSEEGTGDTDG